MPLSPYHGENEHNFPHPHIGMRKVKSVLAIFVGFWLWQLLRLFVPGLEVHPIFIYMYGMIEMRETSDKTRDHGKMRILATFTSVGVGLPTMFLYDWIKKSLTESWMHTGLEITCLVVGALAVLVIAEVVKCRLYCGLAAAIYVILMVSHFEKSMYLYSLMRAFQTILGVGIAWVINVKLLPYPPTPRSLSYWLMKQKQKRDLRKHPPEEKEAAHEAISDQSSTP